MIHTYNNFIIPSYKLICFFIASLLKLFLSINYIIVFWWLLKFEKNIENIKYYIKRHTALLEKCFGYKLSCDVASTLRPLESRILGAKIALLSHRKLWLVIKFFPSQLWIVSPIFRLVFIWICIWFTFQSQSRSKV